MNRDTIIEEVRNQPVWDLCIIGGGATGLGIAVDAAARGLKTLLLERSDFAKGTSSRSTKLVHGGVRYLQQGNIRLVMEALRERGLLLRNAPHLVHNMRFIVPNYKWWEKPFYGIGLAIYDRMAGRLGLGPSVWLSPQQTLEHLPNLDPTDLKGGVLYHDGQFDDARLAISLAQTARQHGAALLNYFPVKGLLKSAGRICGVLAEDAETGTGFEIQSRAVINATGVFTDGVLKMDDPAIGAVMQPSQGIHLVVDRTFLPGSTAIMIPRTDDGRVLFAVPWHGKVVLGTTDTPVSAISEEPPALDAEIDYILSHVKRYLTYDPARSDVRSVFAGLRPLVKGSAKKTAALSRDHLLMESRSGLFTITGGKWTTYRKMAQDATDLVVGRCGLPARPCQTHELMLAGHDRPAEPASVDGLDADGLHARIIKAVREEQCRTVDDFLSRRTRQLLLDARTAVQTAPAVARCLARELNRDEAWADSQITIFNSLAAAYTA
ncbi:MAG: hypothetical protein RJA57_1525 [Bacteroidota bacterium]